MAPRVVPRPALAVDFDGVVHSYTSGWTGGTPIDPPTEGTFDALRALDTRYQLVLFTARYDLDAVHRWLVEHRLRHFFHDITNQKPQAVAYLDDRAVRFTTWAQALADLASPKP